MGVGEDCAESSETEASFPRLLVVEMLRAILMEHDRGWCDSRCEEVKAEIRIPPFPLGNDKYIIKSSKLFSQASLF